jgi:hypothetical protein
MWDGSGNVLTYSNFQIVDANNVAVMFAQAQTGAIKITASAYNQPFSNTVSVSIPHNLGTLNIVPVVYDASNNVIEPSSFTLLDANNAVLTFASPQSGTVQFLTTAATSGVSDSFTTSCSGSNCTATLAHGLGSTQLAAAVYDNGNNLVQYGTLTPIDSNDTAITTVLALTGRAVFVRP